MKNSNDYKAGMTAALSCSILWGVLPVYWNFLKPIDSMVIIYYRIFLMAVLCLGICTVRSGFRTAFRPLFESRKKFFTYLAASLVITFNWSVYILAVNAGYVIQTSMGYFLEPLIVCVFGLVLYREHANRWKKTAIGFAAAGLLVMVVGYRQVPAIALALALSFAVYAAIKKNVEISTVQSLMFETIFTGPIALALIVRAEMTGTGALAAGTVSQLGLLLFAGLVTAVPLGMFSFAAPRLPFITLGLTEYISPSLALLLGIFVFREPFDRIQLEAFILIWIGLVFFTYGEIRDRKRR